jgi:hypothetical protein
VQGQPAAFGKTLIKTPVNEGYMEGEYLLNASDFKRKKGKNSEN